MVDMVMVTQGPCGLVEEAPSAAAPAGGTKQPECYLLVGGEYAAYYCWEEAAHAAVAGAALGVVGVAHGWPVLHMEAPKQWASGCGGAKIMR